ncbi:hypothetical protein CAOG_09196 [Capsaspora owczarzaki ATCC 30864]|uniref:hypothetical protein n=1 Tax=Capsaspora owczarzaki (strain ATCC 30864) TaxID=595528 RepID=UPI0003523FCA|nr:hypothetical protein CAOG_09196 [Capsaspora owczarzaki ATCC 30864]|eukprot:XP_011270913.1 hypothetical protein CAOG_09196 [Capsaspora owczarzaki ATCC 30864]
MSDAGPSNASGDTDTDSNTSMLSPEQMAQGIEQSNAEIQAAEDTSVTASMSFNDLCKFFGVSKFDGSADNLDRFVRNFSNRCKMVSLTEKDKVTVLITCLSDSALEFIMDELDDKPGSTSDELLAALKRKFSDETTGARARQLLADLRYTARSVKEVVETVERLRRIRGINITEDGIKQDLLAALPPVVYATHALNWSLDETLANIKASILYSMQFEPKRRNNGNRVSDNTPLDNSDNRGRQLG